ncbi:MAG: hypothetical protein ACTSRA_12785 [Promethearchaeota archaeon]
MPKQILKAIEIPPGTPDIYYHRINLVVSLFMFFIFLIIGILLIFKKKSDEAEYFTKVKRGYGIFAILFSLCRLFFIIAVYYPNECKLFWIFPISIPDCYNLYVLVGYAFADFGLFSILVVIEKHLIPKTKFIFSILALIFIILSMLAILGIVFSSTPLGFFQQDLILSISFIVNPVLVGVLIIIYIYLALKGTKIIRKNSIMILIAIILIGLGTIIDGESMVIQAGIWFADNLMALDIFYCLGPSIIIIGIIIFYKSLT